MFIGTLPLFVLLALGCPSTGYWSGYYFRLLCGIDLAGLTLKLIAAAVLAAGFIWVRRPAKLHTVFFVAAAVLVAGAMVAKLNPPRFGEPVRLRENLTRVGGWIGVSESPSAGERRFFSGCEVSRWVFFRKDGGKSGGVTSLVLLAVKLGGDVHKLHPTELCMRSGGREVISNREKVVDTTQGPLAVQELRSAGGVAAAAHLTYTWYVGPHWSTGNFMTFRRVWQKGDAWLSYQLVATGGDSEKSAAETIEKFINDALAGGCNE
ncbi:MAG: hypothetical protein PHI35_03155 [Victivallaceae bacterium]|nr:hypothetical protein [Victivallaceae bacterium]